MFCPAFGSRDLCGHVRMVAGVSGGRNFDADRKEMFRQVLLKDKRIFL